MSAAAAFSDEKIPDGFHWDWLDTTEDKEFQREEVELHERLRELGELRDAFVEGWEAEHGVGAA